MIAFRRGEKYSSSGSFSPARVATYIPDGTDGFARRAVLPDAQRMRCRTRPAPWDAASEATSGDPDKSARPKALKAS